MDYIVTDTELTSIADAIRQKGGTSLPLSYPNDFINAINAIPTASGADIPTFTVTWNGGTPSVTCDKTYLQAEDIYNMEGTTAQVDFGYGWMYAAAAYDWDGDTISYCILEEGIPFADIYYSSNSLTYVEPSAVPSGATLITKNITANGTYNASSDNADGYSSVTVNVPSGGGAANIVEGTFTTNSASGVQNVTIPYTGSGYPIAAIIYPTGGINASPAASVVKQYSIVEWAFVKSDISTPPNYSSGNVNYGFTLMAFKSSASNATTYTGAASISGNVFYTSNPTANQATVVKFSNATTLRFYVAASSYGMLPSTDFSYTIVYSS